MIASLGIIAGAIAGMAAILIGGVVLFTTARRVRGDFVASEALAAKRLTLVLASALLLAFAVSFVTSARAANTQTFALSGAERWTVGPFLYIAFFLLLLSTPGRAAMLRQLVPRLLLSSTGGIAVLVLVTGMVGLLLAKTTLVQTAQGLALIIGFLLFMSIGIATRPWDRTTRVGIVSVVVAAAAATVALQIGLGSFPALVVPACAAVFSIAGSRSTPRSLRVLAAVAGGSTLLYLYKQSAGSNDPSAGLQLQMGFAIALVVTALLPIRFRAITACAFAVGIVAAITTSPLGQITVGGLADDSDLTIAQRGFETQAVWAEVTHSPFNLLFGAGPGATVDLRLSPDAATLLSSGRDLEHVPSVHLLTSYLLLKTGLVGLLWLMLMLMRMVTLSIAMLRQPHPDAFSVLLLCLPWCGLAAAIPAATFFFSNPLPALAIGLLMSIVQIPRNRRTKMAGQDTHGPEPSAQTPRHAAGFSI